MPTIHIRFKRMKSSPPLRGQLSLTVVPPISPESTDSGEEEEENEDSSEITELLGTLTEQLTEMQRDSNVLRKQVKNLYVRAKEELTDLMQVPLNLIPSVKVWCLAHGLSESPTLYEFLDACFKVALSMNAETRTLQFAPEDAVCLWNSRESFTIYELFARIPNLFAFTSAQ